MTENKDKEILALAQEIAAKEGIGIVDAMLKAEVRLAPKPTAPEAFTVELRLKPKIARWIVREFEAKGEYSLEQRLAAYLTLVLSRARVQAIRNAEIPPDISEGEAVTMRRDVFQSRRPQG